MSFMTNLSVCSAAHNFPWSDGRLYEVKGDKFWFSFGVKKDEGCDVAALESKVLVVQKNAGC